MTAKTTDTAQFPSPPGETVSDVRKAAAARLQEALKEAHRLGFLRAAGWVQRDDLFADVSGPTYRKDRDHDLATLTASAALEPDVESTGQLHDEAAVPPGAMTDKREEFEAWVRTKPGGVDAALNRRDFPGSGRLGQYVDSRVEFAWQAVSAGPATPVAAVALAAVDARIAELEAQLAPYLEAEAAAARLGAARDRAVEICDALFPKFNAVGARSDKALLPVQWHEKSWWWNGVSIDWNDNWGFDSSGGEVELSSYVGGGDVEKISISIPQAWIDAGEEQWRPLVDQYKASMAAKREAEKSAQEAAKAQWEIETAKATLRRLGVGDAS